MWNLSTSQTAGETEEHLQLTFQRELREATMRGDFSRKEIHDGHQTSI